MKLPRLKEVREQHGWSQQKLSKESGVSRDSISNYETGQREAWPATAKRLSDALGVEIADLVAITPKVSASPSERSTGGYAETPSRLIHAEVLENIAALWSEQLSRGLYDPATLQQMYSTAGVLAMLHEASIGEARDSLAPSLREQHETAEERFIAVDSQIWETLEKTTRGQAAPPDELAARREARRQELRGNSHARHA